MTHMTQHNTVELYSDDTGALILVIDREDAWQLHADHKGSFHKDAKRILKGVSYPCVAGGQRQIADQEWDGWTDCATTDQPIGWEVTYTLARGMTDPPLWFPPAVARYLRRQPLVQRDVVPG